MPLSVRTAIATACALALLGLASVVVGAADLLTGDSASAALGTRSFGSIVSPILVLAAAVPRAVVKRDERLRALAFQFALLAALLLGFLAMFTLVAASLGGGAGATILLSWTVFSLTAALAWSLARPSARAWFREGGAAA